MARRQACTLKPRDALALAMLNEHSAIVRAGVLLTRICIAAGRIRRSMQTDVQPPSATRTSLRSFRQVTGMSDER